MQSFIEILKSHNPYRHANSFKYAFSGVIHALVNEANFRVQVAFTVVAISMGVYFHISTIEWAIIVTSTGFLLAAELINTVVENFIDTLIKDYHDSVKIIKDVSAGFVLILASTAFINFLLIFGLRLASLISTL